MPLDQFEKHVTDPAPGFRCYNCRDKSKTPVFIARLKNYIGDPATPDAIAIISATCGPAALQLRNFVALHDGIVLYRDRKSQAAGISFFPVAEWKAKADEMRESMVAMGFDEQEMPDWMQTGVVFGEIPESANYFVFQPSGSEAGHVFYCDHDDFTDEPITTSFDEFLDLIVMDPPGFLMELGCYTRYSDGKTDIQWIPKEYIPDCGAIN